MFYADRFSLLFFLLPLLLIIIHWSDTHVTLSPTRQNPGEVNSMNEQEREMKREIILISKNPYLDLHSSGKTDSLIRPEGENHKNEKTKKKVKTESHKTEAKQSTQKGKEKGRERGGQTNFL